MAARILRLLATLAFAWFPASGAFADTLFWEDFNGYTSFPNQNPSNDYVNLGLPKISEGADETWYGIRFEDPGSSASSIDNELFVQKCGDYTGSGCQSGGGSNNRTPVARFEDDAGIMLEISTLGYTDVTLDFDWRTFQAETSDKFRAGYFASATPISFTTISGGGYANLSSGTYAWTNWTQLMSASGSGNPFQSAPTFNLPSEVAYLYVAFWLDNGEGDNGKLDNVHIQGTLVPEPATALLLLASLACLAVRRSH